MSVRHLNALTLGLYERHLTLNRNLVPATEQAQVALLLSRTRRLVRDRCGYWNHVDAPLLIKYADGKGDGFNSGFSTRTIEKLIAVGRARPTKYDERGRPTEVAWVSL